MSGSGGYKHRLRALRNRQNQRKKKAKANIAKARGLFESKGQTWDPENNTAQLAALNHAGRRLIQKSEYAKR
jgi:hypothetical protein